MLAVVVSHHLRAHFAFLLNARYDFDHLKEVHFLHRVLDVCVDEERVRLAVDVLDSNLEAVETLGFGSCDFRCKVAAEIFVDDAVGCCKESKDMGDEVAFIVG